MISMWKLVNQFAMLQVFYHTDFLRVYTLMMRYKKNEKLQYKKNYVENLNKNMIKYILISVMRKILINVRRSEVKTKIILKNFLFMFSIVFILVLLPLQTYGSVGTIVNDEESGLRMSVLTEDEDTGSGTVAVTSGSYTQSAYVIPSTIEYDGIVYTVTRIGDYVFYNCTSLTSISIPESVSKIGEHAFYLCENLESVDISEGVDSIGDSAFNGCKSLESIIIPQSVTSLGEYIFYNCDSLNTVTFSPASNLESIGNNVFYGCKAITSIVIPDGVTSVGDNAFYGCTNLESVTIPQDVISIGQYAFYNCTSLTSIEIPENLTYLGENVFYGCEKLTTVVFEEPSQIETIGKNVFYNCTGLTSITLPNGVTHIDEGAFYLCTNLTSIMLPDSLESIGDSAFNGCTSLASIHIPQSAIDIGEYAFYDCESLATLEFSEGSYLDAIGKNAFYNCTGLTSINIPENVSFIGEYAFYNCINLTSITIPAGVTNIASGAFQDCSNLSEVLMEPLTAPNIEGNTFSGCSSDLEIYIAPKATGYFDGYWADLNVQVIKLINVLPLDPITGVKNGAEKTVQGLGLPNTVILTISGNVKKTAEVIWQLDKCIYDPSDKNSQSFVIQGTVVLPDDIANPDDVALSVSILVTVEEAEAEPDIPVSSITIIGIEGRDSVTVGSTLQMVAIVEPNNASNKAVTWHIIQGNAASIDEEGLLLATSVGIVTVRATSQDGSLAYGETDISIISDVPPKGYTVTYQGNGNSVGSVPVDANAYNEGDIVTVLDNTGRLVKRGYKFTGWINGNTSYLPGDTFTIYNDVTLRARWMLLDNGGSSSSTNDKTTKSSEERAKYKASIIGENGRTFTQEVAIDESTGNAVIDIIDIIKNNFGHSESIRIIVPSIAKINRYTLILTSSVFQAEQSEKKIIFSTPEGEIIVTPNTFLQVIGKEEKQIRMSIDKGDKSLLSSETKKGIESNSLVHISLTIDNEQVDRTDPKFPILVSIPYIPSSKEISNDEYIGIWQIDNRGNGKLVPDSRYDLKENKVSFLTNSFSQYAVAWVYKTFEDIDSVEWAKKPIEVMASKGFIKAHKNNTFAPHENITRADYITYLIKTLGLSAEFESNFDDVLPEDDYYETVGIAKKLGITFGNEKNKFNPSESITRQDMMTLTARALKQYKGLDKFYDNTILDRFKDKANISEYAQNSMATLVGEGLIEGYKDTINPYGIATRAEAVVFLYRIYNKY